MLHFRSLRILLAAAFVGAMQAQAAYAGRTVIDSGLNIPISGYCSPNSAGTSACFAYSLPVSITLGGTTYSSFYVNSNGTVSLSSIESFLAPQNLDPNTPPQTSLTDYSPIPMFSPFFSDGAGFLPVDPTQGFDGNLVAQTSLTGSGFTVNWFSCIDPLQCGLVTVNLLTNATFDPAQVGQFGLVDTIIAASTLNDPTAGDAADFASGRAALLAQANAFAVYTMLLSASPGSFTVDYTYNAAALGTTGLYGHSVPGSQFETTGPLANQHYAFTTGGSTGAVPEPAIWMTMLFGFGLIGFAIRRKPRLPVTA